MPRYGKSSKSSRFSKSGSTRRATSRTSFRKALKDKLARTKRALRPATTAAVKANTTKLARLTAKVRGPLQTQTSVLDLHGTHYPTNISPWILHVNDPGVGTHGPDVFHVNNLLNSTPAIGNFQLWQDSEGFHEQDAQHHPNYPCYLIGVDYQFKISGFTQNTHIKIDVIRQKKMMGDFWEQRGNGNFLPQTLKKLKNLAGFSPNEINKEYFTVLQSRKIFLNSRGSSSIHDAALDLDGIENTVDATTRNEKHCHLYVPIKATLKPIKSGTAELFGDMDSDGMHNTFTYDKMHPLKNIWILISTDDDTELGDSFTGNEVKVEIIRKCLWRDQVSV